MLQHHVAAGVVERDPGEGLVCVVQQHQVWLRQADGVFHQDARAVDDDVEALDQLEAALAEPVEPDGGGVRAVRRRLPHAVEGALDHQLLDGVVAGHRRGERVVAGGAQPGVHPAAEVAVCLRVERRDEIGERGGGERMGREVASGASEEGVEADVVNQLRQRGGALGVGDAVEVGLGSLEIRDVRDHGVRRRHRIGEVGAYLPLGSEVHPAVLEAARLHGDVAAHELGERLLQPQVAPPARGDEVAEPHVAHLVHKGVGAGLLLRGRGRRAEQVGLGEGDQARVLHGAEVVLGHEDLVVLAPGVVAEVGGEPVEAGLREAEQLVGVEVLGQRLAAEQTQVDVAPQGIDAVVRAGAEAGDVGGQRRGGGEIDADDAVGHLLAGHLRLVGAQPPRVGPGEREAEGGAHVWLLEVGEDAAGVGRLVLRVEVGLAVDRIDETVHAFAGARVERAAAHGDDALLVDGEVAEGEAVAVVLNLAGCAVDQEFVDGADEIDPGAGFGGGEVDGGRHRILEHLRVGGVPHVDVHPVRVHGDGGGAVGGFGLGEIRR